MVAVAVFMDNENNSVFSLIGHRLEKESTFHNFRKDIGKNLRKHNGVFAYITLAEVTGKEVDIDFDIDIYGEARVYSKEERDSFSEMELPWIKRISNDVDYRKVLKKALLSKHKVKYYIKEDSYLENILKQEKELTNLKKQYINENK